MHERIDEGKVKEDFCDESGQGDTFRFRAINRNQGEVVFMSFLPKIHHHRFLDDRRDLMDPAQERHAIFKVVKAR